MSTKVELTGSLLLMIRCYALKRIPDLSIFIWSVFFFFFFILPYVYKQTTDDKYKHTTPIDSTNLIFISLRFCTITHFKYKHICLPDKEINENHVYMLNEFQWSYTRGLPFEIARPRSNLLWSRDLGYFWNNIKFIP